MTRDLAGRPSRARLGACLGASLGACLVLLAGAGAARASDAASNPASGKRLAVSTRLTVTGVDYLHAGRPRSRLDGRLVIEPVWAVAPSAELSGSLAVNADSDGEVRRGGGFDLADRGARRPAVEISELELTEHLSAADLRLGKQIIPWGIGDGVQPTDSLTPRDLTDPLLDERLGAWGASADLFAGSSEVVLSLLRHAPIRLPALDRRWSPLGALPLSAVHRRLPEGQGAWIGALQVRGYARAFDWSLVARRGPDLAPHLALASPVALTLDYPTMSLLGGWVSVPVGSSVLRSELAWRLYGHRPGAAESEDFATLLVGGEHRFPALVAGKDATLIVEAVREQHTGGPRLPREVAVLDPLRLLRDALLGKLLIHDPTGWEAEAGGGWDVSDGGRLVQLLVRYNASQSFKVELGLDLLAAGGDPAFVPVAHDDRLVLRTIYRP